MAFYDGNGNVINIGSGGSTTTQKTKTLINRLVGYQIPWWSALDNNFATVLRNTVTEWMTAYGGNSRKIPLFVATDHHGYHLRGNGPALFETVGDIVNWDNVSAALNLGDTTEGLNQNFLKVQATIPAEKQINTWGNHEIWPKYDFDSDEVFNPGEISQGFNPYYPSGRMNGFDRHGNRVIVDDMFKVKYLVISNFEFENTDSTYDASNYRIGTEAMNFIISNMEVNDGYKLVILSHVPLLYDGTNGFHPFGIQQGGSGTSIFRITGSQWTNTLPVLETDQFFADRKTGGSGTIVDSDGVEHSYDFSGCAEDSPFICSLHGHEHQDAYCYINGEVLSVCLDKYYPDDTIHFLLIDLENNWINVWKVDNTPQVQNYQIPLTKPAE